MGWVSAVDSSYDELTEDEARRLKAAGVELYIQALTALPFGGLEQPQSRVISLRNATYAGMKIAGYALIGGNLNVVSSMNFARSGLPLDLQAALEFCAIDVEVSGITAQDVEDAASYVRAWLPGKPVVVYTSYNAWVNLVGNPPKPEGSKLWDASWGVPQGTLRRAYGGWTQADLLLHQYSGETWLEGQHVDRNVWLMPDAQPAPPAGTQLDRIEETVNRIAAALKV